MSIDPLRTAAIQALFDEELLPLAFVLKGGTALMLHSIGQRGSLDLDFSIPADFADAAEVAELLRASLVRKYGELGYEVFDFRFGPRPSSKAQGTPEWWGGYECNFKVISNEGVTLTLEAKRRSATVIGPLQERKFRLQISKHEFCGSIDEVELALSTVRVYTPALIAAEKLRAICQQMDEYPHKGPKTPRARDFYDIYAISTEASISMTAHNNLELLRHSFVAKNVDPTLLTLMRRYREFHRGDWAAVEGTVAGSLFPFDYYFDFVADLALKVESRMGSISAI